MRTNRPPNAIPPPIKPPTMRLYSFSARRAVSSRPLASHTARGTIETSPATTAMKRRT